MNGLLLALFSGAACLAIASMVITARRYACAVLAIGEQLKNCVRPGNQRMVSSGRKCQFSRRAVARRRIVPAEVRRDRLSASPRPGSAAKRRQFGYGMVPQPDWLVCE